MSTKDPSLEGFMEAQSSEILINAVIDRDNGLAYPDMLTKYKLVPFQFLTAITHGFRHLMREAEGDAQSTLEDIAMDENRRRDLLRMGPDFIRDSYIETRNKISEGGGKNLPDGILAHPENKQFLAYYALAFNNRGLGSTDRARVVQILEDLPSNLHFYLHEIGLVGLMMHGLEKGEAHKPLAVLKLFGQGYQLITGDPFSLFDPSQDIRVRRFEDSSVKANYPGNYINAIMYKDRGVSYSDILSLHELTPTEFFNAATRDLELYRDLAEGSAKQILQEIVSDENRRRDLLRMDEQFMLQQYKRVRGEIPGEVQGKLHSGTFGHPENRELLAYVALVYHNTKLASENRAEVVQAIEDFGRNLQNYFYSIGLGILIDLAGKEGKENKTGYVLELFNKAYQRKTQDPFSLFDNTQEYHLEFGIKNRLIIHDRGKVESSPLHPGA